ncbi:S9 family peptidase [Oceanobacillus piezotolerans]|uniref:S9 family peptidase n=1 Tax=Oceanobacillus piezotolerans TaxID=2448030 RepID=A0A498D2A0_9BACI|nr:prolyl oligopeptidase family serine peptidase [Oceanobacillus piezotolerans]RLL41349.1 S9 family peptidase [Oceanobacillus piezotolerans]
MIEFPKPNLEQFFQTFNITDFVVSKDEELLLFNSNLNGKMNLWAIDLKSSGFPYLFAQRDQDAGFLQFDPKDRYVLAGYDNNGDENYQIYAISPKGGEPIPFITGDKEEKYYLAHINHDGNRVYYNTSEGNPSFFNTYVRNLEAGTNELLYEGEKGPTILEAVSMDEKTFVYSQTFGNTYSILFAKIDDATYSFTPDPQIIHVAGNPVFTDNNQIYFVTNYESEYSYLAKFDVFSQTFTKVLSIESESITSLKWDKRHKVFYFVTEKGVVDCLYRYDPNQKNLEKLNPPVDVMEKLDIGETGNVYVLGRSAREPQNIFSLKAGEEWKRITNNRVLGISKEEMVEPQVIHYSSFDGMNIEALLFKPKPENDNGYTIFWPHGGPQAAERKQFRTMFQCAVNRGYTIFAPNFRGSTGYGTTFVKLVEQDWGEGPRLDNLAGIEWLFNNNISDKNRLFLVGGSYGGYMALLLHGRHPEYFKAVVDIFGPSDLFTFVNSVPDHWKPLLESLIGDPVRDKDKFIKESPITYLSEMTKPMLVIQGAMDPRVVKAESDQIVAKLKEKGREVEYLVLEDEGHGFSKKDNEIQVYSLIFDFLDRHQGSLNSQDVKRLGHN